MMMDDLTAKIQIKKIKLENALSDLNNEIIASFSFLQRLKTHSSEIIRDLNSITAPAIYFKRFMDVNAFILKYLGFLTEINCKFEMLWISEKEDINSLSVNDSNATSKILLGVSDNIDSQYDLLKSFQNKEDRNEQPIESNVSLKSATLEKVNSEEKLSKINSNNNRQVTTNAELKSNLCANSDIVAHSGNNLSSDIEVGKSNIPTTRDKKNTSVERERCDSDLSSSQINVMMYNNLINNNVSQIDRGLPAAALIDSDNGSSCNEVQERRIHLPSADIPVAEVIPRTVTALHCDSEIQEDIESSQEMSSANPESYGEGKPEVNLNEDDIKPLNILWKVGDEYEVTVEHIQSPSEFYVFIKDTQSTLLAELLQNFKLISNVENKMKSKKDENRKAWFSEQLGSYVLYYSKYDEIWCRAKVINWCLNYKDDFIKVFLVDYGEYKCVSIDDIGAMPECYKKYPACARRCHLYGISPSAIDIDIDTLSWGKESTEKMKCLVEVSKKLKIKIASQDKFHSKESLPVTLWMVDKNNECINDLLVRSKCAVFSLDSKLEPSAENQILEDWNPMKEDFEAYENSYDLNIDDPANYIYGYVGRDYERVCKHFAKTGYCFKGQSCRKEHKKLNPLGFTTDEEEIYKNAFNRLYVPPPYSVVRVQITCLLGVNNFCCIMDDHKRIPEEENLQTLLNFMNKQENIKKMKKLLIPPSVGQIVIAQYSEDHSWYRAKILESQPENDVYSVLYVDYGNNENVSISKIRAIEARYLHLPFQAVRCFIFGIEHNPKVALEVAMDYLNSRISKGHLSMEIISKLPGEQTTLLVHLFDEKGMNIGVDLMGKNYAVHKEEMIISSESETVPG